MLAPLLSHLIGFFFESINNKAIKTDIKMANGAADIKNKGSLKLFQLWLEERLGCKNAGGLMCPFYVLYDFRIITCHLQSSERRLQTLKSINTRLGIDEDNADYEMIYDAIIGMLSSSYKDILVRFQY